MSFGAFQEESFLPIHVISIMVSKWFLLKAIFPSNFALNALCVCVCVFVCVCCWNEYSICRSFPRKSWNGNLALKMAIVCLHVSDWCIQEAGKARPKRFQSRTLLLTILMWVLQSRGITTLLNRYKVQGRYEFIQICPKQALKMELTLPVCEQTNLVSVPMAS